MTPKRNTEVDPMDEGRFESFPTPNTIPAGWDVAAFFEPERRYEYRPFMYGSAAQSSRNQPYESGESAFS